MSSVNKLDIDQQIADIKIELAMLELAREKIVKSEAFSSAMVAAFEDWNILDQAGDRKLWFGTGTIFVDGQTYPTGFLGFMTFLRSRNPGRGATKTELWQLFQYMPWGCSTFATNLCILRHEHGWVYENEDRVYIATK